MVKDCRRIRRKILSNGVNETKDKAFLVEKGEG